MKKQFLFLFSTICVLSLFALSTGSDAYMRSKLISQSQSSLSESSAFIEFQKVFLFPPHINGNIKTGEDAPTFRISPKSFCGLSYSQNFHLRNTVQSNVCNLIASTVFSRDMNYYIYTLRRIII